MDTKQHKETLEQLLETIQDDLHDLGVQNPNAAADWIATPEEKVTAEPDPNVQADRSEAWGERQSEVAALETSRNHIMHALQKIAEGGYGICEICGALISSDRLQANPAARTCTLHMEDEDKLPMV